MANTTQPVAKLQTVLTRGDISGHLQQLFNQGDLEAAKDYIDSIIGDRSLLFDSNEKPFEINFETPNSNICLNYSGSRISLSEKRKKDIDADLPTRIKKGLAPIEEIERALMNNSMTGEEFKEAVEHLEPHVSEHYRLLLTHENQVYERKDEPAIRVELHSGTLRAEEELEREKKAREDREAAEEKPANQRTAKEVKNILADVLPVVSLEEQVKQGEMVLDIINYLGLITDPVEMQSLVGVYDNIGIEIVIKNGVLLVANANEYHEQHVRNVSANYECQELIAQKQEELNKQITKAIFSDAPMSEVNALYAKKEEIALIAQEGLEEGKPHEEILDKIDESTQKVEPQPEEKTVTTAIPEENIAKPDEPQVDSVEARKQAAIERCKALIATGRIDPNVLIRNARENKMAQRIIKECIADGTINPSNYPELAGYELSNDKSGETVTVKKEIDQNGTVRFVPEVTSISKQLAPTMVHRPGED